MRVLRRKFQKSRLKMLPPCAILGPILRHRLSAEFVSYNLTIGRNPNAIRMYMELLSTVEQKSQNNVR